MQKSERSRARPGAHTGPLATVLRQCRRSLVITFVLTLIADVLALTPVIYMLNIFDRILTSRSGPTLVSLMLIVVLIVIFWGAIDWIRSRLLVRLSLRMDWDLAARTFDASFRHQVGKGNVNVQRALANLLTLRQFMTGQPLLALMSAPLVVIYVAVGFLFHPYLAIFALAASLLMLLAAYGTQKMTAPLLRQANDASSDATRAAAFQVRHAETAHALGMQGALRGQWHERHRSSLQLQANASEASGLLGGVSGFLRRSLPPLQLSLAAWLAIEGLITTGMVIAASVLISRAISPMNKLVASWKEIVSARQAYEQLETLLATEGVPAAQMRLPAPSGRLVVTQACVVPSGSNAPVLEGIDFSVQPGESVAVLGPSGSGKTTLTRLLIGLHAPESGSVRLDGVEIAGWNREELGPLVGYVPQEIDFFQGTVAENIARLGPVDPDRVVEAARLIEAHDIILKLPKGYETMLGESGHPLSAGQRQRIAMARAFYGKPRYIVMDEPNAHLDEPGEQALCRALEELKRSACTVILTTHRPRLIGVVDHLLVLRTGSQLRFGPAQTMVGQVRQMARAGRPESQPRAV